MIEISDRLGKKVLINKQSISDVKEYYDSRYPSIRCVVNLLDGNIINSCMSYDVVKNLILGSVIKSGCPLYENIPDCPAIITVKCKDCTFKLADL